MPLMCSDTCAHVSQWSPALSQVSSVPGVVIFRFQAPLCFINSSVFRRRLEILVDFNASSMSKEEAGIVNKIARAVRMREGEGGRLLEHTIMLTCTRSAWPVLYGST